MRKIKKILALVLAIGLMMGMTVVAYAEDGGSQATSPKITINGLTEGAKVTYRQIVEPDSQSDTGWKVSDDEVAAAFANLLVGTNTDLIKAYEAASEVDRINVVANLAASEPGGATIPVTLPGLYLIKVVDPNNEYVYQPMIASVGFKYSNGAAGTDSGEIVAKKGYMIVEKTGKNQFIEIGDTEEFTITAKIPFFPAGIEKPADGTPLFSITDTLEGGKYDVNAAGKLEVTCTVDGAAEDTPRLVDVTTVDGKETFTIDLSDLKDANTNAEVVLKYTATATAKILKNEAYAFYINHKGTPTSYSAITGKIIAHKEGEQNEKLAGAEFVIMKGEEFATLNSSNELTGWVANIEEASKITTGSDGSAEAYGFDRDLSYKIKEYKAPDGYAINDDPVDAIWQTEPYEADETTVVVDQYAEGTVIDTTLSKLPYAGGKGTAAFTGFGILFMSVAAGLYFATKKGKSVK